MPHFAAFHSGSDEGERNAMKRSTTLTSLLLSVGLLSASAQSAELAPADRVTPLSEIAEITLNNLPACPQAVEQVIARKADEHGASYYRILSMEEQAHQPGWRASAIFYL
jgi:hypothetical protein